MALALSSKSQPLTLISCGQLLTSSAMPARRDFLGCCGHNLLRPPGSRRILYRKRIGRKMKIHGNRAQTVLISASLNLNSALVAVTVTALSALSIAYFYHHHSKKRRRNEVFVLPSFSLSQVAKDISDRIIGSWFSDVEEKSHDMEMKTTRGNDKEIEDEEIHVQFQMHDNGPSLEKAESSLEILVASGACSSVVSEEYETAGISPLPALLADSGSPLPLISATEPELTQENSRKATDSDSVFRDLVVEVNSNTASVAVSGEPGDEGKDNSNKLTICDSVIDEAVREDLYTFKRQSGVKTPAKLNGLKAINSHDSSCSSLKLESPLQIAELSAQQSPQISGGSGWKDENNGRVKEHSIRESSAKLPLAPSPNGIPSDAKGHYLEKMRTYNHLLRRGKLAECVALLEDMKRNGLLDMNKVHHAKFFKVSKSQKAVMKAFSFCKLIPNPTLSTFNMLMSVCAASKDLERAHEVLQLAQKAGFKPDCKLYTTLVSTCGKSGKVDAMFEVFHEMVNTGVEPNVNTYGALIDGCAREGQVAKAFGAYGIMRSKNVKPDRVIFNALITACDKSGALHRAFDVLAEMSSETHPIDPDHVTVGALMKACANAGQVDRAQEVYNMMNEYNIRGTPEVYTIAVNSCSQTGDFEFARKVYDDMLSKGIAPDEIFLSALIDVAGHSGNLDAAFEFLNEARTQGTPLGSISYSSLMGACCNAKNWQKALELYDEIKSIKLKPTVSTMNALITALCDGDQLPKAMQVLFEMKNFGLCANIVTYSVLIVACERNDDIDTGLKLLSQAQDDGVSPNLIMYKCIVGMCLWRFKRACNLGEPVVSIDSGRPRNENKWTSVALMAYRETVSSGEIPTIEFISQVLGCLQLPCDASLKSRLVENLADSVYSSRHSNLWSLVDGFGEYDPRAFSLLEEAASSFRIVPSVSFKESSILVDAKMLEIHVAEVYLLTILKGLKHRLAAGAKLPTIIILLPIEKAQIMTPDGEKTINLTGRIGQAVASLLRRLGLPYQGSESYGKIRINGISLRRWLQPRIATPFNEIPGEWNFSQSQIGKGIMQQQRNIRTGDWSME